jgi:hypothetical protein
MSWFPDLGTVTLIHSGDHVRAVGWLSFQQSFQQGDVPAEFLGRLRMYASRWGDSVDALNWPVCMGGHRCDLCGGCYTSGNFGVPQRDLLFVAPEMIVHYVAAHHYLPPSEFITAVMESPLPGTNEYRDAVAPFRRVQSEPEREILTQKQPRFTWQCNDWHYAEILPRLRVTLPLRGARARGYGFGFGWLCFWAHIWVRR